MEYTYNVCRRAKLTDGTEVLVLLESIEGYEPAKQAARFYVKLQGVGTVMVFYPGTVLHPRWVVHDNGEEIES